MAASKLREQSAEITRLRAALDAMTAERDAARDVLDEIRDEMHKAWGDESPSCLCCERIRAMIEKEDKG